MGGSRRDFLKKSIGLVSLSAMAPHLWVRPAFAGLRDGNPNRVLVVLQLDGGNDGLNTVVPYAQGAYYSARPTIGIKQTDVLELDSSVGLHPSLAALVPLYQAQKLAVIQGAGYPEPNRSHFRSREIWQTADPVKVDSTGWLGRYADANLVGAGDLAAVAVGGSLPKSLNADKVVVPSVASLQTYNYYTDDAYAGDRTNQINTYLGTNDRPGSVGYEASLSGVAGSAYHGSAELQAKASTYVPKATYPTTQLATDLKFAAQIITAGVGARVIYVSTGGYDTHSNQPAQQAKLHQQFAEALAAFQADVEGQGLADDVTLLAWSEFGRRVEENGSNGTDHGTAAPMFLMGTKVAGGLHGQYPSLTQLDGNGDLIFTVDFREVYADVLENWLGVDSKDVLLGTFAPLGLFAG